MAKFNEWNMLVADHIAVTTSNGNVLISSTSSSSTSSSDTGFTLEKPKVSLNLTDGDNTAGNKTFNWSITLRTLYPILKELSNDNAYAFFTLSFTDAHTNDKDTVLYATGTDGYRVDGLSIETDHVISEGSHTFAKSDSARSVSFKLEVTWFNAQIIQGTYKLILSGTKNVVSIPGQTVGQKYGTTPDKEDDPEAQNPSENDPDTNTNETPQWTADWSTASIFDLDGEAATSAPPKPTVKIEVDEHGSNPVLVVTVNKEDIFDSDYRVKLMLEVVKDGTERRYSGDDVVAYSDEDTTLTPELTTRLPIELGSRYQVRCRTVKIVGEKEYESEWSEWSETVEAGPLAPEQITICRAASSNGSDVDSIYLEWTASTTAKSYDIQYSTNKSLLDDSDSSESKNTGDAGTKYTLTGFGGDMGGKEYFLRIRAVGENNTVSPWSSIVSVVLGSKPGAPTTWSSQSTITIGEPVDLYWVHNSMDGSSETYANLTVYLDRSIKFSRGIEVHQDYCYTDGANKYLCIQNGFPEALTDTDFFEPVADDYDVEKICDDLNVFRTVKFIEGMSVTKDRYYTDGVDKYLCIKSSTDASAPTTLLDTNFFTKVAGGYDENEVSFYTLETPEHIFTEGARVKWQVATAGITNVLGPASTPRVIDVYQKPSVQFSVLSYVDGEEKIFDTLTRLPIHVKALALPKTQSPIGYYLSVTAKSSYTTRDAIGNPKVVHEGDLVYYKYFDTSEPLDTYLSAGDITLENNVKYDISCVVSMNSGLSATGKAEFTVGWSTEQYLPNASVAVNGNAYATAIRPYCEEVTDIWYMVNKEDDGRYTVGFKADENIDNIVPLVKSVEPLGKNLLDINSIIESNNCEATSLNGVLSIKRTDDYVAYARLMSMYLTAGTKYVLSYTASSASAKVYWWKSDDSSYDPDGDSLKVVSTSKTYTPSESGYYCIAFGHGGAKGTTITIRNAQVEVGSKATAYEKYQGVNVVLEKTSTGVDIYTSGDKYYCILKQSTLVDDVMLSVYRREYDGSFTEIAKNVPNQNVYIPDPHPSLDYARYRIVATSKTTGYVSYYDLPSQYIGCKSVIIQWDEEWNEFDADKGRTTEKTWTGSLLDLPYNIDVSDSRAVEVEMVKYIGRKHPVAYYGTHLGETASWSCAIPKTDKDTLYALRRLAAWAGNVYVREPSGVGYWANVVVNFSQKHNDPVVPVSFEITRVEGGM